MENKLYGFSRKLTNCLNKHQFVLVLVLSLFHVGLSYIHNLGSGRADPLRFPIAFSTAFPSNLFYLQLNFK